nr:hypothetical protein [Oceanipulchritudo coccoides]
MPAPGSTDAVQPLREASFIQKGLRLCKHLPVQQAAGDPQQNKDGIGGIAQCG